MRNILIYATKGINKKTTLSSEATDKQSLIADIEKYNSENSDTPVEYNGMKMVVSESSVTLESDEAQLPTGPFTLMLLPGKVKSGSNFRGMTYMDLMQEINDRKISTPAGELPTNEQLIELIENFDAGNSNPVVKRAIIDIEKNVAIIKRELGFATQEVAESDLGESTVSESVDHLALRAAELAAQTH